MNCKGVRRSGRSLISGTTVYCYGGGKENKKNLSYFRWSASRDLRPGPPEHKARVPPTGAQQKQNILSVLKVDETNKLNHTSGFNPKPVTLRSLYEQQKTEVYETMF